MSKNIQITAIEKLIKNLQKRSTITTFWLDFYKISVLQINTVKEQDKKSHLEIETFTRWMKGEDKKKSNKTRKKVSQSFLIKMSIVTLTNPMSIYGFDKYLNCTKQFFYYVSNNGKSSPIVSNNKSTNSHSQLLPCVWFLYCFFLFSAAAECL